MSTGTDERATVPLDREGMKVGNSVRRTVLTSPGVMKFTPRGGSDRRIGRVAFGVRDCDMDPDQGLSRHWTEQPTVSGMQKVAACTSSLEPPNTDAGNNCEKPDDVGSVTSFATFSQENCISWKLRKSDGDMEFNSGGNPDDCEN
jgi:hypothetical protein